MSYDSKRMFIPDKPCDRKRSSKESVRLLRAKLRLFQRRGSVAAICHRLDPVCSVMLAHLSGIQVMQGIYPLQ